MGTSASHQVGEFRASEEIERAVGLLRSGGVVAFPNDTLYGLGADVFNEAAAINPVDCGKGCCPSLMCCGPAA